MHKFEYLTMPLKSDYIIVYFFGLATIGLVIGVACLVIPRLWLFLANVYKMYVEYTPIIYPKEDCLSPVSKSRLNLVARKTLVLDMDETMITSWLTKSGKKPKNKPRIAHDFKFYLPAYEATIYVYKRPYLDHFLDRVSKWYDLTVFTAGAEIYASPILDFLDRGRGILNSRLYRQDCIEMYGTRGKSVLLASPDLANVLLLDNSSTECSFNAGNAILIKSYEIGSRDEELINLLPFLDALRFMKDVRSVLKRCTRFEFFSTILESAAQ
ncbi:CTD nuclear envelope phosphatase 1 homolog [Drosophila santomea]|uniref:CTD nuclear envelope phosphatase 1 homolog n=1 Tax=Drosophila santomea TaxID=129105 RepID=UPI001952C756|nr:CTD nuclear envelope phosphatase 1 homolog [Drosophila santomea]